MADLDTVIQVAESYEGYLEKKTNSQLDDFKANAGRNNYTRFARDYYNYTGQNYQGQAWCAMFVSDCFVESYGLDNAKELLCGNLFSYTPTGAQLFKNRGQWITSNPQRGDVIFFKNSERICHVGIVNGSFDGKVFTVEGNTSGGSEVIPNGGGVVLKAYDLNNSRIAGYGRPDYSGIGILPEHIPELPTPEPVPEPTPAPAPAQPSKNELIECGQGHSINFVGNPIECDGIRGNETRKQAVRVLQQGLNLDYGAGLTLDGEFGPKTNAALGNHYVQSGETQYMVTALEILLFLKGYNPVGVECPGQFDDGLAGVVAQYQSENGLAADGVAGKNTFKSLIA